MWKGMEEILIDIVESFAITNNEGSCLEVIMGSEITFFKRVTKGLSGFLWNK